jgi:hypothetical protein
VGISSYTFYIKNEGLRLKVEEATPILHPYAFLACTDTTLPVSGRILAMCHRNLLPPSSRYMGVLAITFLLTCISEET